MAIGLSVITSLLISTHINHHQLSTERITHRIIHIKGNRMMTYPEFEDAVIEFQYTKWKRATKSLVEVSGLPQL